MATHERKAGNACCGDSGFILGEELEAQRDGEELQECQEEGAALSCRGRAFGTLCPLVGGSEVMVVDGGGVEEDVGISRLDVMRRIVGSRGAGVRARGGGGGHRSDAGGCCV